MNLEEQETVAENEALSDEEKLLRLKEAKGGTWRDDWKPYCMKCSYSERMDKKTYGFRCPQCGNKIGWNLKRLKESPLNRR